MDIDMLKVDIPCNDMFPNEVVVHLGMLCLSKVDATKIAIVDQDSLKLDGFTCNHNRAPVFGLCARKCDGRLLLATLGDVSTSEREGES